MSQSLLSKEKDSYGDKYYQEHLFEQYKLYVESAEKISNKRHNTINYFIAINTPLLALLGWLFRGKVSELEYITGAIISTMGVIVCMIFKYLLKSYAQMNKGKFEVIHEIERHLPLTLYAYEWKVLGKGEDKKTYLPFSKIESYIPKSFLVVYFLFLVVFLGLSLI